MYENYYFDRQNIHKLCENIDEIKEKPPCPLPNSSAVFVRRVCIAATAT